MKQDIMKVENIQRRFTKRLRVHSFKDLTYADRLTKLGFELTLVTA